MRRLLPFLFAFIPAPATMAEDVSRPVTAMVYWQKPLGVLEKRDSVDSFGFRLDRTPAVNSVVLRKPIVDIRFNDRGFHSLAFRGSVLHQNQPASGVPAPEINWWLVGGIAVGAAIVINNENKRNSDAPPAKGKGGG